MNVLVPLIGLWALGLGDTCFEVKKKSDVIETRCARETQTAAGRVASCVTESGAKIQLFKTRDSCETALLARRQAEPRLEPLPGKTQRIPTH